jgi:hypothetical protein
MPLAVKFAVWRSRNIEVIEQCHESWKSLGILAGRAKAREARDNWITIFGEVQ